MNRRLQFFLSAALSLALSHTAFAAEPVPRWPDSYFLDVFNRCPYAVTVTFSADSKATVPANTFQRLVTPYNGGEPTIKFEAEGKPPLEIKTPLATLTRGTCYYGRRVDLTENQFLPRTADFAAPEVEKATFFDGIWSLNKDEKTSLLISYPYDSKELLLEIASQDAIEQTFQGYRYSAALALEIISEDDDDRGGLNLTLQPDLVQPFIFRGPVAIFYRGLADDGTPTTITFRSWIVMTVTPTKPLPLTLAAAKPQLGDISIVDERFEALARAPRLPVVELLHPLSIDDPDARRTEIDELVKSMAALGFAARVRNSQLSSDDAP